MQLIFRILRSLIYIPLFIWLFGWLVLRAGIYDKHFPALPGWSLAAGIILMIVGLALVLYCIAVFIVNGKGTPAVFDAPTPFVATGAYTFVRNPMYIGFFIFLFGLALFHHSLSMISSTALVILFFHLFVMFYEEPVLKKPFGKSYLDYKRKVNRWIPRVK